MPAATSMWTVRAAWRLVAAIVIPLIAIASAWWSIVGASALAPIEGVMLAILLLAAGYWALEPIPPVATSLLVIALLVACIGLPAQFGAPWARATKGVTGWTQFLAPAGSPVMLLMLGSLALALGVHRAGLARLIGAGIFRRAGASSWRLAISLAAVSAFLSLWMSNTATAALMFAIIRPIWDHAPEAPPRSASDRRIAALCVMGVAIGANVGGIASPVGTPPCAIVFTALDHAGAPMTFLGWMARGVPIAIILLVTGLLALRWTIGRAPGPVTPGAHPIHSELAPPPWAGATVLVTFAITVALWITSTWTGIPIAVAALVPLVLLPAFGVIRPVDFAHLEWDVLLLILGGLVLGVGLEDTGLADTIVRQLPLGALPPLALVACITLAAVILSAFMSNTAVANLLTPIAMSLAVAMPVPQGQAVHAPAVPLGFAVALGSGISMMLPVATPANAMAHRTGAVTTAQFLFVGTAIGVVGVLAITGAAWIAVR